jgi:hypothetical protein
MEKIGLTYQGTRPYHEGVAVWHALDRATWQSSAESRGGAASPAIVDGDPVRYWSTAANR